MDRAVEATYRPSDAVRRIDIGPYCIGGPAMTPHVLAQQIVPAGGGVTLPVARVALLFSDLTGSTALYARVGDAVAFRLVQDHFDLLSGIIEAEGGVVVKTIGDAVMAAFPDEGAAVRAALLL